MILKLVVAMLSVSDLGVQVRFKRNMVAPLVLMVWEAAPKATPLTLKSGGNWLTEPCKLMAILLTLDKLCRTRSLATSLSGVFYIKKSSPFLVKRDAF